MVALGGSAVQILIKATDQATAVIEGVQGKLGGLGGAMEKLRVPMLAVGAASVGIAALAIKSASDFETAMVEVTSIMDRGQNANDIYGESVKRIAKELPIAGGQVEVAKGLYATLAGGITDTADATMFLEAATKVAIGSNTDLETVVSAGTKTMIGFGLSIDDTNRIMDTLVAGSDASSAAMPEFADAMLRVAPIAGEMGLSIENTAGTLAGLSKVMPSVGDAATSMNSILMALLKPSEDMKKILQGLGYESGDAAVKELGLVGALQAISKSADEQGVSMETLFGSVREVKAILPLLGNAAEQVGISMKKMADSNGAAQEDFQNVSETSASRMIGLQNRMNDLAVNLGEKLVPILEKLLPIVEGALDLFGQLDPVFQAGIVVIGMLVGAFAALWPVISAVSGLIGGAGGLGAVIALLAGPIGWVIAAVALLAAAWATNFGGIRDIADQVFKAVSPIFEKLFGFLQHLADFLVSTFGPVFEAIFGFVSGVISAAWENIFRPVFEWIMQYVGLVIDTFDALLSALQGDFGPLSNILNKWGQFFFNTFNGIITAAWNFISGLWNTIANGINNIINWLYNAGRNMIQSIVNGLASIGWSIWNTIMGFIPSVQDIINRVWGAIQSAGNWVSQQASKLNPFHDFIARPGMGIQTFSSEDTIIGVKDISKLAGLSVSAAPMIAGERAVNVYMQNVTFANDYDVDAFKRRLAEAEEDAWASRQNK